MNHIYFTALGDGAGLAAELAAGEGAPRVYVVEPTGAFENDPNGTDQMFPGNPTRSYRSREPIRIVGEVTDWTRQTRESLHAWRDRQRFARTSAATSSTDRRTKPTAEAFECASSRRNVTGQA